MSKNYFIVIGIIYMLILLKVTLMDIYMGNEKYCMLLMRVRMVRPVLFLSIEIFMLEMLMKRGIFLIGWLIIFVILILVVLIPTTHYFASLIWPLFGVKLANVLIMIAHLVPIIFLIRILLDLAV